jgi:catechol 2,3-dioxygenase-like lactoylglutathione lyase family enzyme
MRLLRAATLCVSDIDRSIDLYSRFLDYSVVERDEVSDATAAHWGAPASTGARMATLQPSSGADVFLRFVEQPAHPDFLPLRSYGWAAVEICVQDVLAVNARMEASPFEIIGPPKELDGVPTIFPMQVKGPDGEIVYLTQIRGDMPNYHLPRAESLIDKLFILVLAASDLPGAMAWAEKVLGLTVGTPMEIKYTMLAKSFGKSLDTKYRLATLTHERDVFLEFDQYPPAAHPRPGFAWKLPQGVAVGTLLMPKFQEALSELMPWALSAPARLDGPVYAGRDAVTLRGPDGTLFEVVDAG